MLRHDLQTGHQTTAETHYTFENSGTQAATRFSALADIFDPGTIRHLTEIGVGNGWHCLEVGAGAGSIATWLCDRVGSNGHVLATDIDTQFLETLNRSIWKSAGTISNPIPSRWRNSISYIFAWCLATCQIETRFLAGSLLRSGLAAGFWRRSLTHGRFVPTVRSARRKRFSKPSRPCKLSWGGTGSTVTTAAGWSLVCAPMIWLRFRPKAACLCIKGERAARI